MPQIQRSAITPRYENDQSTPKWEQLHQLGTSTSKATKRDLRNDEVELIRGSGKYTFKPDLTKSLLIK